jgi:two-component system cell cycle response regulator DivK
MALLSKPFLISVLRMHSPLVILLVQPERDDREMYADFLRSEGFLPISVSSAADALTIAPRVDVVVTALLLPGPMDGVELVTRLKGDDSTKNIAVIVLTACVWQSDRDRAAAAGCDVFLEKPCLPDVLVRQIRRVLALRHVPKPSAAGVPPPPPRIRRTS